MFWGVGNKPKKTEKRWCTFLGQHGNRIKLYRPLHFWIGVGCSGLIYLFLIKNWRRKMHCKMGDFSSILWRLIVPLLVGWFIILPPVVDWYIMGCEPDPLPSYNELSNCFYYFMLINTQSPSILQLHVPNPDPTISFFCLLVTGFSIN